MVLRTKVFQSKTHFHWIYILSVALGIFCLGCSAKKSKESTVSVLNLNELKSYYQSEEKLYILNFWATWCKPCVAELPYFEELNKTLNPDKAEIILVSLDFEEDLKTKVLPLIQNKNIKSKVILLNEGKPVYWIDKVSEKWSGSIPATLIYHPQLEKNGYLGLGNFNEGELDFEKLNKWIYLNLNNI